MTVIAAMLASLLYMVLRLYGASSAPHPCRAEISLRGCRTDRDPWPSPPGPGRTLAGQAPGLPALGPRAARCGKPDPSQRALGCFPRSSRDASALAPVTRRAKVDEAASPTQAPRDRSEGLQADPSDGRREPCGARKPRFAFLPATIRPGWSLPVGQSLHSRTGCICEGRGEESVGPLLGELARVSEDDLNLGIPDLQACQHIGEPGTGNML